MSVIVSKIPIISENLQAYNGSTSDGDLLYCIQDGLNEIHIFDSNYCYDSKVDIDFTYLNITYNKKNDLFYLLTKDNKIVSLDRSFNNPKEILLDNLKEYKEKITTIYYDEQENSMYFVFKNEVISIGLDNMETKVLTKNITNEKEIYYTAVCNYGGKIYISYNIENQTFLSSLNKEGNIEQEIFIDDNCYINNIIEINGYLKLFTTGSVNYIYETNITNNEFSNYYFNSKNLQNSRLNYCNNYSNYNNKNMCCTNNCNNCNNCKNNCCNSNCKCSCECNCECHKKNNCKKNLCDIIESIALEEAGISHILNAEGEKIQKILEKGDTCAILNVNESVNKTINCVSMLEQILLAKLEVVAKVLCDKECCKNSDKCEKNQNCNC